MRRRGRYRAGPAILSLALGLFASTAQAFVLAEDALEGDSTSAGGTVRMYNLVLKHDPDFAGAISLLAIRPQLELKRGFGLDLVVHDELTSTSASLSAAQAGGALALGSGVEPKVWLPLQWTLEDQPTFQLRDRFDWLYARYTKDSVMLTVGRQPVSIGRGRIFTPEDLIAPFSPLQIDTEFKHGADAARLDWNPSESVSVLLVAAAARDDDSVVVGRTELAEGPLRVGFMAGSVRTDLVAGTDFFFDLGGGTDLHGEATATHVTEHARRPGGRSAFERAVVGTTSEVTTKLHLTLEAYWNGAGAAHPGQYVDELSDPRVGIGETYTLGRIYAGFAADWEAHPLLHVELATLANLRDPGALVAPTLRYSVAENASLIAGAYVPIARAGTEFDLYPRVYHVDAKLWF